MRGWKEGRGERNGGMERKRGGGKILEMIEIKVIGRKERKKDRKESSMRCTFHF